MFNKYNSLIVINHTFYLFSYILTLLFTFHIHSFPRTLIFTGISIHIPFYTHAYSPIYLTLPVLPSSPSSYQPGSLPPRPGENPNSVESLTNPLGRPTRLSNHSCSDLILELDELDGP